MRLSHRIRTDRDLLSNNSFGEVLATDPAGCASLARPSRLPLAVCSQWQKEVIYVFASDRLE